MKHLITKERIDKRLCIDCAYFCLPETEIPTCGLIRSLVDDSPLHFCKEARYSSLCNGNFWQINPNIEVCENQEETNRLMDLQR